ncbi:MAG TPA: PEP-CTERM sorting domain-containing protein [Phycisphaerae bacterium]|nr:PEP-CTERM sorting domain-containing protein [Phycisphaerae bacterium]
MSYVKCALGVVGALGLAALTQQARATTLADLMSGGPVVRGNVIYSDFTDNAGGTSSPGAMLPGSSITVNFSDPAGVSFSGNWNTLAPGANHTAIGYTITTTGNTTLTAGQLFFAGQVVRGNAAAFVGETLTDTVNNQDYSMSVYYDGPNGQADNLRDSVSFNPATTQLKVIKSIDVTAADANSFAAVNFVENTFTTGTGNGGTQPSVPEPMSLALLPLGIAGLALRKKLAR